jgi:1-acyl-sn-glycerol-3-phosphate acyltransferase
MKAEAMTKIIGVVRLGLAVMIILLATVAALATSLIPGQIRGIPLAAWSVYAVVHLLCFVFRIRVTSTDTERLRTHAGLVFPNHTSALDVLALYHCAPMRFLAAHDVEDRPLIGWMARKLGTVFVRRDSPRSRLAARQQVAAALEERRIPPVVLFPEGRLGPGYTLFPFRHGAFGIAVEGEIPYLPCAIRYTPLDVVLWRAADEGEGMWTSIWRMVQYTGRVDAELIPLEVVHPTRGDNAKELAAEARQGIADALGLPLDVELPA